MKLRIKGDSIRLRITPSEVAELMRNGKVTELLRFSSDPEHSLRYTLSLAEAVQEPAVRFDGREISVLLPMRDARAWADSARVSIEVQKPLSSSASLILLVEKDFACLDLNDEENADTFPNPNATANC